MNPGWIAGGVRARLLLEHRAGAETARELGRSPSLPRALEVLAGTPYAPAAGAGQRLEDAQRAVAASVAFSCRVLAAWLPRDAAVGIRAMASWFELANIEDRSPTSRVGSCDPRSSWACSRRSGTRRLRPGAWTSCAGCWAVRSGATRAATSRRRSSCALRVVVGEAGRERRRPQPAPGRTGRSRSCSPRRCSSRAGSSTRRSRVGWGSTRPGATRRRIPALRERLPGRAAWALAGVDEPSELWRAEPTWWRRVGSDAESMTRRRLDDPGVVLGAVALLALDAVRVATRARRRRSGRAPRLRRRCSMPSADLVLPARMSRVAVVAPRSRGRDALVELARRRHRGAGGQSAAARGGGGRGAAPPLAAGAGGRRRAGPPAPIAPDVAALEQAGGQRLLAGEVELEAPCTPRGRPRQLHRLARVGAERRDRGAERRARDARRGGRGAAGTRLGRAADAPQPGGGASGPSARSCGATEPPATATSTRRCSRGLVRPHVRDDVRRRRATGSMLALLALWLRRGAGGDSRASGTSGRSSRRRAVRRGLRLALRRGVRADRPPSHAVARPARRADHAPRRRARRGGGAARRELRARDRQPLARERAAAKPSSRSPASPGCWSSSAGSSSPEASTESLPAVTIVGGDRRGRRPASCSALGLVLDAGRGAAAVTQAASSSSTR